MKYVHHNSILNINYFENNKIMFNDYQLNTDILLNQKNFKHFVLQTQFFGHRLKCHSYNHEFKNDYENN